MAGTNRRRSGEARAEPAAPSVVLVEPQLGENIGACARAMMNFGLADLRLVRPRGDWPNYKAINTASGAESILDAARTFDTLGAATADLQHLYATTARDRDMVKPTLTPREAASRIRHDAASGGRSALLFGRERTGLENEDVAFADAIVTVPANPSYASLNLAQAVLVIGYEWFQLGAAAKTKRRSRKGAEPATQEEIALLFAHLEAELDEAGFLFPPHKRPRMVINIRNVFSRASLTDQEVRTLRGIIVALTGKKKTKR